MNSNELMGVIIGALGTDATLFNLCYLKSSYFTGTYRSIFVDMRELYFKKNELIITELVTKPSFNSDLYFDCTEVGMYYTNIKEFNALQSQLLDAYKKRKISEYTYQLAIGEINLEDYECMHKSLMEEKPIERTVLKPQDLLNACVDNEKEIIFKSFKSFGSKLRLAEKDFMVIAAGTGVGKTAFALNLLSDLSNNYDCVYINMEMTDSRLYQRLVSMHSRVQTRELYRYQNLSNDQQSAINAACNDLGNRNIEFINKSQSLDKIRAVVAERARLAKRHLIVFIDHVGLVQCNARSAYDRITEVAKTLRAYNLDYGCTIIALSQLSRITDKFGKKPDRPNLSMLRDSGELEQSARKVVFVWEQENNYSLVIEKNDSNAKGIVDVDYYRETQIMREK